MSSGVSKAGKVRTALDRLDGVEETLTLIKSDIGNIANFINSEREGLAARFAAFGEIVEALTQLLGEESVNAKVEENRKNRDEATVSTLWARVNEAVEKNTLKKLETVEDDSLVLFKETNKDGVVTRPGVISAPFSRLSEELKTNLKGKNVGAVVTGSQGSNVEVVGIYQAVPQETPVEEPNKTEE